MDCRELKGEFKPCKNKRNFWSRFRRYLALLNPANTFMTDEKLNDVEETLKRYNNGTLERPISDDELCRLRYIKEATYHPDTGQKVHFLGRYSSQIFMDALITGAMLTYYKTAPALMFWQWINQSYNTFCVSCNRPAASTISDAALEKSYLVASGASMGTALILKWHTMRSTNLPYIFKRYFPLAAAAVGTFAAIPIMRCQDLKCGIPVYDESGSTLGTSVIAAKYSISDELFTRAKAMAPAMILPPLICHYYEVHGSLCRKPWLHLPLNLALVGCILTLSAPWALAKKKSEMYYCDLESHIRCRVQNRSCYRVPFLVFNEKRCPYQ